MLLERMQTLAGEMKFEEAQKVKEKYLLIESYRSKSEVVSSVLHNIDVFSIEEDESNSAFINYLHITNGAINQAFSSSSPISRRFGSVDKVVLPVPDRPKKIAESVPSMLVLAEQCMEAIPRSGFL